MAVLDEVVDAVAAEKTVVASVVTLLDELKAKLDAAGTDPVKLAAIRDDLVAQTQALADAVARDTAAASEVKPSA